MKKTITALLALLLTACAAWNAPLPTRTPLPPTIPPTAQPTRTLVPAPSATPTMVPTVAPSGLDTDGPWLLFESLDGLVAVNVSGEGGGVTVFGVRPRQWSVSPRGRYIAALTVDNDDLQGASLHLVNFPGGKARELSLLTNKDTEPQPGLGAGDPAFEAVRAIIEQPSLAWSPDGYTLAYISALAGKSADLYSFDVRLNRFERLTDGPSQAFSPSWSPDGTLVAHLGATTFGTGAGLDMDGGWAVRLATGDILDLFTVNPKSQGEKILGWRDGRVLVMQSFEEVCGWYNLRLYHPETLNTVVLQADSFSASWFAPNGALLMNINADLNEACKTRTAPGLYLFAPGETSGRQVLPDFRGEAAWQPQLGAFLLLDNGQLSQLSLDGTRELLITPFNSLPVVSPGGKDWAWLPGEGVFLGKFGQEPRQIFDGLAHDGVWTPDGTALFFFGDSPELGMGLFRAQAPGFEPRQVLSSVDGYTPLWIVP